MQGRDSTSMGYLLYARKKKKIGFDEKKKSCLRAATASPYRINCARRKLFVYEL